VEARHLLNDVDLPRDVPRTPGRHVDDLTDGLEAQPAEERELLVRGHLEAHDRVRAIRVKADLRNLRQFALHVHMSGPAGARELDDQLRRELRRRAGEMRIDTLLPAVRTFGPQTQPVRAPQDADRLEVGRLQEDVDGRIPDLRLLAAHDPGQRDPALGVGDQQI
jgi:hypothetical protein